MITNGREEEVSDVHRYKSRGQGRERYTLGFNGEGASTARHLLTS